jgi:GNAT superfamily N-acetyltransferase
MTKSERFKQADISIRRATLRDLDTLVDQRHKMWKDIRRVTTRQHRIADRAYRKWVAKMMRRRRFVGFLGVTKEGRIVAGGCVWMKENHPSPWSIRATTPYLMSIYTDPKFRGKGLATGIVKEAMKWSREKGYHSLSLHASDLGKNIYSRLGFDKTREMRVRFRNINESSPPRGLQQTSQPICAGA